MRLPPFRSPRALGRSSALATVTIVLAATPSAVASQTSKDTAVRIVENRAPVWSAATAWRFSESPVLQIGAVEGDPTQQLNRTGYATRLSDGRLVIAQSWELRVFSPAGKHLQTIGRRGQGPGEFALGISGVAALPGDTIAVGQSRSIMFFDPRGTHVRSVPTVPQGLVRDHFSEGARLLPDGSALITLYEREPSEWQPGIIRPRQGFVRVAPGGARVDTAGFFPGFEQVVVVGGSRPDIESRPFGRATMFVAGGDRLYIGDNDRYAIRAYSLMDLRPLMEIRRTVSPIEVTSAAKTEWARKLRERVAMIPPVRRAAEEPLAERAIARANFPRTLPAFARLAADRLGNLWVLETSPSESDGARYAVHDRNGRYLGTVATPRGVTVLELGSDYMIGLWKNEDEVEFVRVYSLIKP